MDDLQRDLQMGSQSRVDRQESVLSYLLSVARQLHLYLYYIQPLEALGTYLSAPSLLKF